MERIYLNVPFKEKEEAKTLGAFWDPEKKKWYCWENNKDVFDRWMPLITTSDTLISSMKYQDLSDEQRHSIDLVKEGKNILVDACIGSGKTTTIQVMCNELADFYHGGVHIVYLTYNTLLKIDAKEKIIAVNTVATNYDGFAYKALIDQKLPTDYEKNVRLFNEYNPPTLPIDILILDEYQDIKEDIAIMLNTLKQRNPKMQIVAVGDIDQKINNVSRLEISSFIQEFLGDYEKLNFTYCFRLNEEHAKHLGDIWGKKIIGVNKTSRTEIVHNEEDIVRFLADKEPKDILVLGSRSKFVRVLNLLEYKYPEKFNKNTVYASIKDEDGIRRTKDQSNSAIFTTFDSSKGLERRYCVILDFTQEYWIQRRDKPNSDYKILRNLFLVGASRGKDVNMFLDDPFNAQHLISNVAYHDEKMEKRFQDSIDLLTIPFNHAYFHDKVFTVSDMYDFMYAEDVAKCSSFLKTKKIRKKNQLEIEVETQDGNIDLSSSIGIYVESAYFENYDLEKSANMILLQTHKQALHPYYRYARTDAKGEKKYNPISFYDKDATIQEQILMMTATATGQDRYCWQVEAPFVKDEEKSLIKKRLKEKFTGKEEVQTSLEIDFLAGNKEYEIHGRCDVVKNNTIFELKFTEGLKETDYLQLAFYLCAMPGYKGVLWNVRTNEAVSVEVTDKEGFLKQTVKTISRGNLEADEFRLYQAGITRLDTGETTHKMIKEKVKKKATSEVMDFTKTDEMIEQPDLDPFFGVDWDEEYEKLEILER